MELKLSKKFRKLEVLFTHTALVTGQWFFRSTSTILFSIIAENSILDAFHSWQVSMVLLKHISIEMATSEQAPKNTVPQICITSMFILSMTQFRSTPKTMANMSLVISWAIVNFKNSLLLNTLKKRLILREIFWCKLRKL